MYFLFAEKNVYVCFFSSIYEDSLKRIILIYDDIYWVFFLQEAADPLDSEAVGQYRNGGSPSNGTADSERTLEVGYLQ